MVTNLPITRRETEQKGGSADHGKPGATFRGAGGDVL
jgi:hypothetical protein